MQRDVSFNLTAKQIRVLNRCIRELFTPKAFGDAAALIQMDFTEVIRRLISVSSERGVKRLLSDQGVAAHDRIVATLRDIGMCSPEVLYADLWSAVRKVVERCLADKVKPEDATELVSLVANELTNSIQDRWFVAPVVGVTLVGVEELQLGGLAISQSVDALVAQHGKMLADPTPAWLSDQIRKQPCISGSFRGTFEAARLRFREQTTLASGLLAVIAGYEFDRGATAFNIHVPMVVSGVVAASGYLHWSDGQDAIGWSTCRGAGQSFEIDAERAKRLTGPGFANYGFAMLNKISRSDVEDSICRAIYWYGDAHRDSVPVMQFVKYWSCLECFFTLEKQDITEALAIGVTSVLTHGHFQTMEKKDYKRNRDKVKAFYTKRSQALHAAVHGHVTAGDLIQMSQWAACVITNFISFASDQLPDLKTLFDRLKMLDEQELQKQ